MERATVPIFKLYGETRHWPTPDLLHCESIPERSRLHNWHIHPHLHADLVHLLHLSAGEVTLELEGNRQPYKAPLFIVVPAMSIHSFHFSSDTQGHILTLAQPLLERLDVQLGPQAQALYQGGAHPLDASTCRIAALVAQLDAEYRHPAPGRESLLDALITALTVETWRLTLDRSSPSTAPRHHDRAHAHLYRYQALIEAQFRQQPSVEQFAHQLGVTSAHLNLLCRRLADRSALQVLHERLLLEAKRQLTYTNMTVGQVADSLGFSEPAYFTRFFKRLTGLSPRDFRLRQSQEE
ncbi:helix-turn-helix domain-containing protein [Vreelandella rituensis]|uniref:Helix-turn-helix domain-containing protein n=1 Tax=Vreelandella rituensis TaxID=2282306 RepID=A0A368TUS2_9GAMM|nr:helix-turn-helix domain-containing protein [Halomonas rituensis]RCV88331.1 helix-turn-helix domain-containing protein [Halomonas rituensis]